MSQSNSKIKTHDLIVRQAMVDTHSDKIFKELK